MNIFSTIAAGDSATWKDNSFIDSNSTTYSSAGYTLTYEIRGPGMVLTLTAIAYGTGWQTSISTAQSAALTVGRWWWAAYASATGVRVQAGSGYFDVTPNLQTAGSSYDGRSDTEKALDAVSAAIKTRIDGGMVAEYSVAGRSLRREPIPNLVALETRLKGMVRRERAREMVANGLGNPSRLGVRFR